MLNTGLFTQSLAGADPASSAISDEGILAGPLSSKPLGGHEDGGLLRAIRVRPSISTLILLASLVLSACAFDVEQASSTAAGSSVVTPTPIVARTLPPHMPAATAALATRPSPKPPPRSGADCPSLNADLRPDFFWEQLDAFTDPIAPQRALRFLNSGGSPMEIGR